MMKSWPDLSPGLIEMILKIHRIADLISSKKVWFKMKENARSIQEVQKCQENIDYINERIREIQEG